jgi:hypothetical protein
MNGGSGWPEAVSGFLVPQAAAAIIALARRTTMILRIMNCLLELFEIKGVG